MVNYRSESKRSWPILRHYLFNYLKGLSKTTKNSTRPQLQPCSFRVCQKGHRVNQCCATITTITTITIIIIGTTTHRESWPPLEIFTPLLHSSCYPLVPYSQHRFIPSHFISPHGARSSHSPYSFSFSTHHSRRHSCNMTSLQQPSISNCH